MNKYYDDGVPMVDTDNMEVGLQLLDMQELILNNMTSVEAVYRVLLANNLVTEEDFNKLRNRLRTEVKEYSSQYESIHKQRDLLKSSLEVVRVLNKGSVDESSLTEDEKELFDRMVEESENIETVEDMLKLMYPDYAKAKEDNKENNNE